MIKNSDICKTGNVILIILLKFEYVLENMQSTKDLEAIFIFLLDGFVSKIMVSGMLEGMPEVHSVTVF